MRAVVAALVTLDGGPPAPGQLERLAASARLPRGGAPQLFRGQGVGLLSIPAHPAPSPAGAGAPPGAAGPPEPEPACQVVVDGTLDNRAQLARELALPPHLAAPAAAPRLIAAAYRRWGNDCASHLVGELAFLLWDPAGRKLLAAGDPFGMRELYQAADGRQLRIASQLQMVVDRPGLADLDDEYFADFLLRSGDCRPATPFKSVQRLPGGYRLTVAAGRVAITRWWQPAPPALDAACGEEETAERFRALLAEAVERCLHSGGRAWAELSGGLDSSAIVSLAHEILARDPATAAGFATVSHVWKDTPQSDERRFQEPMIESFRLVNHRIGSDDLFFDGADEECRYRSQPDFGILFHGVLRAESDLLRAGAAEVLLSGMRAEPVVLEEATPPVHLADALRSLRLPRFSRELMRWQRATRLPLANLLVAFALRPLLGGRRMQRWPRDAVLSPLLDKGFAARLGLRRRAREAQADARFPSIAQQLHYELLVRSEGLANRGSLEWSCELRYPFAYRPLVELALAIPWEHKLSPDTSKPLLRRAMAGRLPPAVLARQDKAGPGPAACKAFARRWGVIEPLLRTSPLVRAGILDAAALRHAAELIRFGAAPRFVDLFRCLACDIWLRHVMADT